MNMLHHALCAAVVLSATCAAAQNPRPDVQKTKVSLGTATPGGGFPLYGGAVAEAVNQTDASLLIEPRIIGDERGFFCETYRREIFAELGIQEEMVQDNHSRSRRGIVRGMHFQPGMGKLVSCAHGAIVDVLVDIRRGSGTFGHWEAFELSDSNHHQLYCPSGFAHGHHGVTQAFFLELALFFVAGRLMHHSAMRGVSQAFACLVSNHTWA